MNAVSGKKIVYLFRRLSQKAIEDAWMLSFVTENGRTVSVDADSTATKDGPIRTPGVPEQEVTTTSILAEGDERADEIEDAIIEGEKFEIWEVNLAEPSSEGSGKFKGKYFQGYGTEFEKNSNAEDMVEVSITFGLEGTGKRGSVTVTTTQQEIANYAFVDTKKTGA